MLYQLEAVVVFLTERVLSDGSITCKHHGEMRQVLAVGTRDMLLSESKRWKKVASVWAEQEVAKFEHGTFGKPSLRIELKEMA